MYYAKKNDIPFIKTGGKKQCHTLNTLEEMGTLKEANYFISVPEKQGFGYSQFCFDESVVYTKCRLCSHPEILSLARTEPY